MRIDTAESDIKMIKLEQRQIKTSIVELTASVEQHAAQNALKAYSDQVFALLKQVEAIKNQMISVSNSIRDKKSN